MSHSEEKAKRIAVGATVAGVLVIIFLVIVMIYGFVRIGVLSSQKKKLLQEIDERQKLVDTEERSFEYYSSELYLEQLAREYGCKFPEDK